MAKSKAASGGLVRTGVVLYMGNGRGLRQPADFALCRFGVQVYTPRALPGFEPVELTLSVDRGAAGEERFDCTGIAIESVRLGRGRYRTFVKILDLPERLRESLHCVDGQAAPLCNFCRGDL